MTSPVFTRRRVPFWMGPLVDGPARVVTTSLSAGKARGFACVLHISPNGADRVEEYRRLEEQAQVGQVGLWSACTESPCD